MGQTESVESPMSPEELSLDQAWELLQEPNSVLIDVRTTAEWTFVGVPDLGSLGKEARLVEWTAFPSGEKNPEFLAAATQGLDTDQPILLLCRSGARSRAAGEALTAAGYTRTYNVTAGFEGPLGPGSHRVDGWKSKLPWQQS